MSERAAEMDWEQFVRHIELCLNSFYDYGVLHANPVVHLLASGDQDEVEQFRDLITGVIDKLRPEIALPTARAARTWTILKMRYLDQQDTARILYQMALSKRQFYRENTKAVESVASILWERVVPGIHATPTPSSTLESEIHRVTEQSGLTAVELKPLLSGVIPAVEPLAQQRDVHVRIAPSMPGDAYVYSDRVLLRQLLFVLLSDLLSRAADGAQIAIHWRVPQLSFQITPALPIVAVPPDLTALAESLQIDFKPGSERLDLTFNETRLTILIVDDNPDVLELFRQYLLDERWQVMTSNSGTQAMQIARDQQPDVVILDLMLPGQDGLEVLQALKAHPATSPIPVLVCSVLNMGELALSLGADAYLHKPPSRAELIDQLAKWRD